MALKARVLLYAASDLFVSQSLWASGYEHPELIGYVGGDRTERWQRAKKAAKAVMDLGIYHLYGENGGWKRLMIPDQKLPGSLDSLWGKIIEYVQQLFPDDPFIGIENACYGDCVLLSSGKKIAFYYDGTCVGYEMDIKR